MTDNAADKAALAKAVERNDVRGVENLLRRIANFSEQDEIGWTLLMMAADRGYTQIARLLVAKGAAVNKKSPNGITPLMMAAYMNHIDIAQLLIDNGADVGAANNKGVTAQDVAESRNHTEMVQLLKEAPPRLLAAQRRRRLNGRASKSFIIRGPQP